MNTWDRKDKRITILSLFRDLSEIKNYDERMDKAIELSHRVFLEVPTEEEVSPELKKPVEKYNKVKWEEGETPF